jgi:hypothetical protein
MRSFSVFVAGLHDTTLHLTASFFCFLSPFLSVSGFDDFLWRFDEAP